MPNLEVQVLKRSIEDFRRRTRTQSRVVLAMAVISAAVAIGVVVAMSSGSLQATTTACLLVFGLLTFSWRAYERFTACEFDCNILMVSLTIGGFEAFVAALQKVKCNKLTQITLPRIPLGMEAHNGK